MSEQMNLMSEQLKAIQTQKSEPTEVLNRESVDTNLNNIMDNIVNIKVFFCNKPIID
jgi:hypothetical protein